MTGGISFAPGQVWLVRRTLADPLLGRVAQVLARSDPALAEFVERGILFQSVPLRALEPAQRELVRQAVVAVTRELLAEGSLLRSLDESAGPLPDPERDENRRQTVQQLLDLAESEAARAFAAGDPH